MSAQSRLYLAGWLDLLVGLSAAGAIYLTAGNDDVSAMGYEIIGGEAYLVSPENSKKYVHDLQSIGGKSAVLADQFSRWFVRLWHGRELAGTVAILSIFTALVLFFIAYRLSFEWDTDSPHNDDHPPDS